MRAKGLIYTFLTLKNHIYSTSINSIFVQWRSTCTILGKVHAKIEKNNTCQFLRKWSNKPKMSKFWLLTFKEQPFERFNQVLLIICCLCHPKKASCKKGKKVIAQFLRKFTLKFFPFDFLDLQKSQLQWLNHITSLSSSWISSQGSCML